MLAQDDAHLNDLFSDILKEGITCETSSYEDPANALNDYNNYNPDLIITDYYLSKMSCTKLIEAIRQNRHRSVPIVLIGPPIPKEEKTKLLSLDINYIVELPFDDSDIITMVKDALYTSRNHT